MLGMRATSTRVGGARCSDDLMRVARAACSVCVCESVHFLSAFLRGAQPRGLTNESEVSSPSNRRHQCLCAGGGAGRPKAYCLLGRKIGSSAGASALHASGRHRNDPGQRCTRSVRVCGVESCGVVCGVRWERRLQGSA